MADDATFKIPKEVIEPIVREQITAGVVAALGNPSELIATVIDRAMKQKVNDSGRVDKSDYYNRHNLVEVLATKAIHEATKAAIVAWVEKSKPAIQEQVEKALTRRKTAFAKALVDGLVSSTRQSWSFTCNVGLSDGK